MMLESKICKSYKLSRFAPNMLPPYERSYYRNRQTSTKMFTLEHEQNYFKFYQQIFS